MLSDLGGGLFLGLLLEVVMAVFISTTSAVISVEVSHLHLHHGHWADLSDSGCLAEGKSRLEG